MALGLQLLSLSRILLFLLLMGVYAVQAPSMTVLVLAAVGAAFYTASSAFLVDWIRTTERWRTVLLWAEMILASALNLAAGPRFTGVTVALLMPVAVTIFLSLERPRWGPALLGLAAAWILPGTLYWWQTGSPDPLVTQGLNGIALLFFGGAGLLMRSLRDETARSAALLQQVQVAQAALEEAHRQLQQSAARRQEMAVLEERQRIAREIHDSVAHALTALVVQAQVGRRLIGRDPEQAAAAVGRCEDMARAALQETRQAVRALHPSGLEQLSDIDALQRLGRDFGIATGMAVTVTADAAAAALPPDPTRLEQLYRIFQESLTNAQRHGQARTVEAALTVSGGTLHLVIRNDGQAPASLAPGVGLQSMAERARSVGGSIAFEPGPIGMTVRVTVPLSQGEIA